MKPMQIYLSERLASARNGQVCQPEYLPCLILQWARMPIKSYFGSCVQEQEQLYGILGLAPEDNPSYQDVAEQITLRINTGIREAIQAADLLAAPVCAVMSKRKGG